MRTAAQPGPTLRESAGAAMQRQAGWFAAGAALATLGMVVFADAGRGNPPDLPASGPVAAAPDAGLAARVVALEDQARRLEAALAERVGRLEATLSRADEQARQAQDADTARTPGGDRLLAALLHLQTAAASSRPWLREFQLAQDLAPPGLLARPLAEVLASHAARGVPTEAQLRERFAALAPALLDRAPREGGLAMRAMGDMRAVLAGIGLGSPPPPEAAEAAVASIGDRLRQGDLAGAVSDAATLDEAVQPLLSGWLAQARARLAVEQAVQETLLRILGGGPGAS